MQIELSITDVLGGENGYLAVRPGDFRQDVLHLDLMLLSLVVYHDDRMLRHNFFVIIRAQPR